MSEIKNGEKQIIKKVKLSKTQVGIAKRLGVPLELYAQKVAEELRKENG